MMPQYFKPNDQLERNIDQAASVAFSATSDSKSLFYDDAYNAQPLGALIYDLGLSPLVNAIKREVFIVTFNELFQSFALFGSIEAYISVFKKIFGDDVTLSFTVPAPGKLIIDIHATTIVLYDLLGREIVDEQYVFTEVIDEDGNNIAGQGIQGIESEYDLNLMLREMIPAGIFYDINLTIG